MKISEFFQEPSGKFSSKRLGQFLILGCFISEWINHMIRTVEPYDPPTTILGFIAFIIGYTLFAGKIERGGK